MQFQKCLSFILALGLLSACSENTDIPETGTRAGVTASGAPGLFPHDRYSTEDTSTFTGRRVNYTPETDPTISQQKPIIQRIAEQLNALDGFGTSAGAWIRFSDAINTNSVTYGQNVFIGYFDGETPVVIPSEAAVTPGQILLRPHLPLPPNSEAFFLTTNGILDANDELVKRDPELKTILSKEDANPLHLRIRQGAQALVNAEIVENINDITSLSVFTTQSIHEQSLEIADRIQNTTVSATATEPCVNEANYRVCHFEFTAPDFVGNNQTIDEDAINTTNTYTLKGIAYLPLESHAPYEIPYDPEQGFPVSIFGHGLTGSKTQASLIARHSAPLGVATISIDSPQHGEHPLAEINTDEELSIIFKLFGIETTGVININTQVLRDGWRHSNLDKLALVEALKNGIELDGDNNTVEFDASRISYLGASLGAIQGSEFLALSTDISAALLAVGGARISDIVRFGKTFQSIIGLLLGKATDEEKHRFYVLLQTGVEVGDGVNWAAYVMQNRLRGDIIPDIAMQSSIPDEIVPPETAIILARTLGVTLIGHTPLPDDLIPHSNEPVSANHSSGRTAAYFQTDWMWRPNQGENGEYVPSTHDKSPESMEAIAYWLQSYRTHLNEGIMTLSNPYPVTGAPEKPSAP